MWIVDDKYELALKIKNNRLEEIACSAVLRGIITGSGTSWTISMCVSNVCFECKSGDRGVMKSTYHGQ